MRRKAASRITAFGSLSVKLATLTLPVEAPSVELTAAPVALSEASAMVALVLAVAALPPASEIFTLIGKLPSSA
jgi:hypothetical protein